MRNGICVKCGSHTVRAARNGIELGERPSTAYLRPHLEPGFRGIVRNQAADVWNLVCVTCGHLEWAIYDANAIAFVNQHWVPVPVQAPTTQPPPPPT